MCGILAIFTKANFFIDIAIAWALQSFIGNLALAKYLEGKKFDE
ncbi:MAG: monovalent cation/H+ antiporter complex subunit F [Endomicrobia bacterium]|nr:monovalent cation/H+ antiporter complex subunit F [Endomicrobiia bacterium]